MISKQILQSLSILDHFYQLGSWHDLNANFVKNWRCFLVFFSVLKIIRLNETLYKGLPLYKETHFNTNI